MKKILVLLLVLAVAGGLFALDGEFSLSGSAQIGAYVNLKDDPISVVGQGYFQPYDWWGPLNGNFRIGYGLDALSVGLVFNSNNDDTLGGELEYDAENFKFQANTNLAFLLNGYYSVGRLWGYYKMLGGMLHLEAAYVSRDEQFWYSDTTGTFAGGHGYAGQSPLGTVWPGGSSFTDVDGDNYLLASVDMESLSFGVILPYIFGDAGSRTDELAGSVGSFPAALGSKDGTGYALLDDVMKRAVFGLKFSMQPIEVAAQFQMGNYGVYFGGKWFVGPVTVGLSFMGILDPDSDKLMKFGGGVNYNPGAFGATVNGFFGLNTKTKQSVIGIEPEFFYQVIPTHLQFETKVGFYFTKANKDADLDVTWAVQPQIFWNFLGTGAGGYWSFGTGMIVRYRLVSDSTNALDVTFKWSL